jgi:hypothetical protein
MPRVASSGCAEMIKRWRLKNFKSFRDLPALNLAQINVLAVANSSGKSSIIQSILLLKQTLQYGSENRSIALNGPLLRLGAFEDVRHFDATGESLEIGVEFELAAAELSGPFTHPSTRALRRYHSASDTGAPRHLSLNLSYSARVESLEPHLKRFGGPNKFNAEFGRYGTEDVPFRCTRRR